MNEFVLKVVDPIAEFKLSIMDKNVFKTINEGRRYKLDTQVVVAPPSISQSIIDLGTFN